MSFTLEPWVETLAVLAAALAGSYLGLWLSRLRSPWWLLGYLLALPPILAAAVARWFPELCLVPPFQWIVGGRVRFAALAVAGPMVLLALRSRVPRQRDRFWISALASVVVGYAILPFLTSALVRPSLLRLETRFAAGGICRQGTSYTCGPAAAVTALRRLGLAAQEGEIAVSSHSTPTVGTLVDSLVLALRERYGREGLSVEYRRPGGIADLAPLVRDDPGASSERPWARGAIAVIKHSFLVDHYVAVLQVTESNVVVGDPLGGLRMFSHEEFLKIWRRSAIILSRMEP
jgi:hypothetical protein